MPVKESLSIMTMWIKPPYVDLILRYTFCLSFEWCFVTPVSMEYLSAHLRNVSSLIKEVASSKLTKVIWKIEGTFRPNMSQIVKTSCKIYPSSRKGVDTFSANVILALLMNLFLILRWRLCDIAIPHYPCLCFSEPINEKALPATSTHTNAMINAFNKLAQTVL